MKKTERAGQRLGIQSIEVGFRIVEALSRAPVPRTLKELSAASDLAPSNCHRYLASFVRAGFVVQDEATSRYELGPLAVRAGLAALSRLDPVAVGLATLPRLIAETGHSALLAILGEEGAVIVRWLDGPQPVRTNLSTGSVLPIFTSATGRAFLAYCPQQQTDWMIRHERKSNPSFDVGAMRAAVRAAGVAEVSGDFIPGLAAASAPLLDYKGEAAAAFTLIGLRTGFTPTSISRLRAIAAQASRELGWTDSPTDHHSKDE